MQQIYPQHGQQDSVGTCYTTASACTAANAGTCVRKSYFDIVLTNTSTGINSGSCKSTTTTFNSVTGKICNPTAATTGMNCDTYLSTLGATKSGNGCYVNSADCAKPAYVGGTTTPVAPAFRWIYNTTVKKCVQTNHRYSNTAGSTYDRDVDDPSHRLCSDNAGATCYKSLSECSTAVKTCSPRYFCNTSYSCVSSRNGIVSLQQIISIMMRQIWIVVMPLQDLTIQVKLVTTIFIVLILFMQQMHNQEHYVIHIQLQV